MWSVKQNKSSEPFNLKPLTDRKLKFWQLTLIISLFLVAMTNNAFWKSVIAFPEAANSPLFLFSLFIVLLLLTNTLLTFASFRCLLKPSLILILIISASLSYFMDNYATMIDKNMIQNAIETDTKEARELLSVRLAATVFLLGILPALIVYKLKIDYPSFAKGLLQRVLILVLSLGGMVAIILSQYQDFSSFGRNHREVRHFINPANYLFSLKSVITSNVMAQNIEVNPIENDAALNSTPEQRGKPSLVILVVGETARAQNFSLNGYNKNTNPLLSQENLISFKNTWSCGTSTAESLPCMFSKFTRSEFSSSKGKSYEGLMDVINHSGVQVLWRDNNSGCKGNCTRIPTENLMHADIPEYCHNGECFDEILLHQLETKVEQSAKDHVIVLHQKGNHGPAYFERYPESFEKFKPACKTNQLSSCSQEEISNAYDNALLYTDYFLSKTISFLKNQSEHFNTAMVYISDHGESLGENNLYLHGMPYMVAPDTQKHVPFLVWLSEDYKQTYHLNERCLQENQEKRLEHDLLFSSMLGLLDIKTSVYDPKLDIFSACRTHSDDS